MKGMFEVFKVPIGKTKSQGVATLSTYEFINDKNPLHRLRSIFNDGGMMMMDDGKYVKLNVDGTMMMSDTRMEKNSNRQFIRNAHGRVFIGGLGIGLIIHNLRDKIESGVVTEIVVMEKYQDVIDLIKPYFEDLPIQYICADLLEWIPSKDEKFDTIYFDIWSSITTENLPEIAMLHQRWKFRKNKGGWMHSWMQEYLRNERRQEQNSYW